MIGYVFVLSVMLLVSGITIAVFADFMAGSLIGIPGLIGLVAIAMDKGDE